MHLLQILNSGFGRGRRQAVFTTKSLSRPTRSAANGASSAAPHADGQPAAIVRRDARVYAAELRAGESLPEALPGQRAASVAAGGAWQRFCERTEAGRRGRCGDFFGDRGKGYGRRASRCGVFVLRSGLKHRLDEMRTLLRKLRKRTGFWGTPSGEPVPLQALVLPPLIALSFRVAEEYRAAQGFLRRWAGFHGGNLNSTDAEELQFRSDAGRGSLSQRTYMLKRCLVRSLTLWAILLRRGIETDLRIGFRRSDGKIEGHSSANGTRQQPD